MWTFLIADVSASILGADFLHFELKPDLKNKHLRNTKRKLQSLGHLKHANLHSVQISLSTDTIYHKLLKEFHLNTKLPNPNQPVQNNTVHHKIAKDLPVMAKPRRLAPDRLKIAKTEFQNMMHLGYLQSPKSNYASLLHMVSKIAAHILAPIVEFLEGCTNRMKSHSSVCKSSEPLKWNENAEQAFIVATNAVTEATLLRHPIPAAELSLSVDASDIAIGTTLSQLSQGRWKPIDFFQLTNESH
ncbi:transposon Ty3-G Gag-Pol polyprotein [Trichonephila clavipes]|nr:transposon Ty3-G Gag-Pol polyprotein [Trichonephila clavipes]